MSKVLKTGEVIPDNLWLRRIRAALVFCLGPVDSVIDMRVSGIPINPPNSGPFTTSQRVDVDEAWLVSGALRFEPYQGGVEGPVYIRMGDPNQVPSSAMNMGEEDDRIPAMRGVLALIYNNFLVGAMLARSGVPKFSALVKRIHKRQSGGISQWNYPLAEIGDAQSPWDFQVRDNSLPPGPIPITGWTRANGPFGDHSSAPKPVTTEWEGGNGVWIRRTVTLPPEKRGKHLWLTVTVDNACFIYWNGVLQHSINSTNAPNQGLQTERVGLRGTGVTPEIPGGTLHYSNVQNELVICAYSSPSGSEAYLEVAIDGYADMNPAHIIRECITDPDWGMGYPDQDCDIPSFNSAAEQLYHEGFGLSFIWDKDNQKIEDFIGDVLRHIDANLYIDRTTGKFKLVLIRADYNESTIPQLSNNEVERIDDFGRPAYAELTNSLTLNYWDNETDAMESITLQDIALARSQGAVVSTKLTYDGITKADLAMRVAQRDLKALSSPLISCTVIAYPNAASMNVGDVFKLTWPDLGLNARIMRIIEISFGDGVSNAVKIRCVEDAFSIPDQSYLATPKLSGAPVVKELTSWETFETPYFELCARFGKSYIDSALKLNPDLARLSVCAGNPLGLFNGVTGADVYVDGDKVSPVEFCRTVTLNHHIDAKDDEWDVVGFIPDDVAFAQIGSEIIRLDGRAGTTMYVSRGFYDTVPVPHLRGTPVYFWQAASVGWQLPSWLGGRDYYSLAALIPNEFETTDVTQVKIKPFMYGNIEIPLAEIGAKSVTMVARALAPYAPMNLKINGESFPETVDGTSGVTASWEHRNRADVGTIRAWGDVAATEPEPGTTYNMKIYNDSGALVRTYPGLTSLTHTYSTTDEVQDGGPWSAITVAIESVRDGIVSYQMAQHTFEKV